MKRKSNKFDFLSLVSSLSFEDSASSNRALLADFGNVTELDIHQGDGALGGFQVDTKSTQIELILQMGRLTDHAPKECLEEHDGGFGVSAFKTSV